jgi:hypothetical protein
MRNLLAAISVALIVGIALAASSASALVKPRVFTLLEADGPNEAIPLGDFTFDRAPVGGDQFVARNPLYRWTGTRGVRVGHDLVLFTFMTGFGEKFTHSATVLFQAQVYLPDGTLFVEGYASLPAGERPGRFKLPVVGGTGVYGNARGYLKVRAGRRTLLEFHLMA